MQAHDYACFFWKRSEFRNKQAKSDTLLLLEITQSAHHFELVIDEFGLLTHTHKDATDVDFLACAAPVIDWVAIWIHCFFCEKRWRQTFDLPHSKHFGRIETLHQYLGLLDAAPGHHESQAAHLILLNLSILKNINSAFVEFAIVLFFYLVYFVQSAFSSSKQNI